MAQRLSGSTKLDIVIFVSILTTSIFLKYFGLEAKQIGFLYAVLSAILSLILAFASLRSLTPEELHRKSLFFYFVFMAVGDFTDGALHYQLKDGQLDAALVFWPLLSYCT